jgi:hypothetical protein
VQAIPSRCAGMAANVEQCNRVKTSASRGNRARSSARGAAASATNFDLAKRPLRGQDVVIMTDADVDWQPPLRTLLLTFFFRHMQDASSVAGPSTWRSRRCTKVTAHGRRMSNVLNRSAAMKQIYHRTWTRWQRRCSCAIRTTPQRSCGACWRRELRKVKRAVDRSWRTWFA